LISRIPRAICLRIQNFHFVGTTLWRITRKSVELDCKQLASRYTSVTGFVRINIWSLQRM
jgi:hypothetical protein